MNNFFLTLGFITIVLLSCEEIKDPANQVSPPMISINFQADTTLVIVELQLEDADSVVDTLFSRYNDIIENGNGDSTLAWMEYTEALEISDSLTEIFSLLKSNKVILDSVFALHNASNIIVDTTNSVFNLPLDMNADSSYYVFKYFNLKDTLAFTYQTKIVADAEKINVVAFNLKLIKSTFDSYSRLYCNDEICTSGEIEYQVFF